MQKGNALALFTCAQWDGARTEKLEKEECDGKKYSAV